MTSRALISGLIGGILAFAWGAFSWGMSDLWSFGFKPVPNEAPLLAAIEAAGITESNAYYFPPMPADPSDAALMEPWRARYRSSATGLLLVHPSGAEPMPPIVFIRGFAIEFAAALLLAIIISIGGRTSVLARAGFLLVIVIFTILATHGVQWNFLAWPTPWGRVIIADTAVTWLLAGLPAVILMRRTVPAR